MLKPHLHFHYMKENNVENKPNILIINKYYKTYSNVTHSSISRNKGMSYDRKHTLRNQESTDSIGTTFTTQTSGKVKMRLAQSVTT